MGFSRQDYWSELPFPSPGHLLNPGIEPASPTLAGGFFSTELPGKPRRDVLSKTSRATSWGHSMVNMPAWPSKHWPPRLSKCRAESTESCLGSGYGAIRETPSVLAMFWSRGQQAPSTIWLATCFRTARKKRMVLPFLNGWGKNIKRRIIFHDMWKWYEIHIALSINKVWLELSPAHLFTSCLWLLMQWNGRVTTESTSPTKPQYLFSPALQDKFVSLVREDKVLSIPILFGQDWRTWGFPSHPVVKSPPANAGDVGLIPGREGSTCRKVRPCSATREVAAMRSLSTAPGE